MRRPLILLAVLFTLTGGTALLAEQIFEKLLSTLIGASTPAAATVLALYFGGLTAGGLLYGRVLRPRIRRPLKAYAFLEGTVAIWALVLDIGFDQLIRLFVPVLELGNDRFWLLQVCRVAVAGCWILPATIPMGASFPSIVDALEQMDVPNRGRAMSGLYACNLLGAIAGAVIGPAAAFPAWGLDGTLLLIFCVNTGVAGFAFLLDRSLPAAPGLSESAGSESPESRPPDRMGLLIGAAFLSGLLFFSLEVIWTQLIATVIGNSVYAFAAMLTMVLTGLGCGAALISVRFPKEKHIPAAEVGLSLLGGAVLVALLSNQWQNVPGALVALGGNVNSFAVAEILRWTMAGVLLIPPATALGMVYPALFRLDVFPTNRSGAAAGSMVAANSVGSILGAFVTAFLLIPAAGSEFSLRLMTSITAGLGLVISWVYVPRGKRRAIILLSVAAFSLVLLQPRWDRLKLTSGKQVYFADHFVVAGTVLKFFHEDTAGGFTTVVENPQQPRPVRTLLTNGKFQGDDGYEMTGQTAIAVAPMMFVRNFGDGLSVGLGTGRTAYAIGAMGFQSVDVAEIAPGIVGAAEEWFSGINGQILRAPGTRLFLEDGRNLLLLRPKLYDLITVEISSVWFAGATNLYSREFYRLAHERLKPGGVFQQWIQVHHIGINELASAIATVRDVFPHVSFWVVGGPGLIVASDHPQQIQPSFLSALQQRHASLGWSEQVLAYNFPRLLVSRLLAPEDVTEMTRAVRLRPNTDRNRYFEYATPRYNNIRADLARQNTRALARFATFPLPELLPGASGPLAEMASHVHREHYLRRFSLAEAGPPGRARPGSAPNTSPQR